MLQSSSTVKAPSTGTTTECHSNSWRSFHLPGAAAPTREGCRACSRACCAGGTARTIASRLPCVLRPGAFCGAKAAALRLDSDNAECDRVHSTPIPGVVGNRGGAVGLGRDVSEAGSTGLPSFEWLGDNYILNGRSKGR